MTTVWLALAVEAVVMVAAAGAAVAWVRRFAARGGENDSLEPVASLGDAPAEQPA